MRTLARFGLTAAVAIAATASTFAADVTVGRFYAKLAQTKQLSSNDAASAEASLRGAGFALPSLALDKKLTEGDIVSISNSLGIQVTTSRPDSPVTEAQMDGFVTSFGHQLGAPTVGKGTPQIDSRGGDPGNSGNGKGKKKGHNKSSSEPEG